MPIIFLWTVKMFTISWSLTQSNIPGLNFAVETTCVIHLTTCVRQLPYEVGTTECKLLDYISSTMTGVTGRRYYRLIKITSLGIPPKRCPLLTLPMKLCPWALHMDLL